MEDQEAQLAKIEKQYEKLQEKRESGYYDTGVFKLVGLALGLTLTKELSYSSTGDALGKEYYVERKEPFLDAYYPEVLGQFLEKVTKFVVRALNNSVTGVTKDDLITYDEDESDRAKLDLISLLPKDFTVSNKIVTSFDSDDDDSGTIKFFFDGVGAQTLVYEKENKWTADFSDLEKYNSRSGYARYGGKIIFEKINDKIVISEMTYAPFRKRPFTYKDKRDHPTEWKKYKFLLRSTAFVYITLKNHLLDCHLTWSRSISKANDELRISADKDCEPLFQFLNIFTLGARKVNSNARVNLSPFSEGILLNAFNFTQDSWKFINKEMSPLSQFEYSTLTDTIATKQKLPAESLYAYRMTKIYEFIKEFVKDTLSLDIINLNLNNPSVINFWKVIVDVLRLSPDKFPLTKDVFFSVITEIAFRVSMWHYHVGTVIPYLVSKEVVCSKITDGGPNIKKYNGTVDGYKFLLFVGMATAAPQIKFSTINSENCFFGKQLKELNEKLKAYTENSPWDDFNASDLETSVGR